MATDIPIPESLDFTAAAVKKAAKRIDYRDGVYAKWIVTDAGKGVSKNNHLQLRCKAAALRDVDDANSRLKPTVLFNLTLPKANPNVPGHTAPNTMGLVMRDLHAMFPEEVPLYPRREGEVLVYKGEEIEKGDEEACRDEVNEAVAAKLNELWTAPSILVGMAFYGLYGSKKESPEFKNLDRTSPEADPDLTLTDPDDLLDDGDDEEPAAEPTPKAKGKGKGRK